MELQQEAINEQVEQRQGTVTVDTDTDTDSDSDSSSEKTQRCAPSETIEREPSASQVPFRETWAVVAVCLSSVASSSARLWSAVQRCSMLSTICSAASASSKLWIRFQQTH